jgi:cytochrome c
MKKLIVAVIATAGILFTGAASAQAELAQKNCGSCHALDTKKMGPSFKDAAAKFKGKKDTDVAAAIKASKAHGSSKASDADLQAIGKWMLTL